MLRVDIIAGVTVAAYLVPQAMAYAQLAGLPAVAGLWSILGPLAVYAALGTSLLLSAGPESTTALMTATVVGPAAAGDPGRYLVLASALALLVGAVCLVAWLIRLGFLADLLSRPVLIGDMAGMAVLMIAGQLGRLTGTTVSGDSPVTQLASVVRQTGSWHRNGPSLKRHTGRAVRLRPLEPAVTRPFARHGARGNHHCVDGVG